MRVRRTSAGWLLHRTRTTGIEVFLVHPGGPYWARKDAGAWSIPKGEFDAATESAEQAARREFREETWLEPPAAAGRALEPVDQPGGKRVIAFMAEWDGDPEAIRSNTCTIEWPPRSGRLRTIPEVDRAAWFPLSEARVRILRGQLPLLDELARVLGAG